MDRDLPKGTQRKRLYRITAGITAIFLVLLIGIWGLNTVISPTLSRAKMRTARAELGRIEATISASGTVVPEFEQVITSPVTSTIEQVFCHSGDTIKAGQRVLELDKQALVLAQQKLQDELDLQKTQKRQLLLQLERQTMDLQAEYDIKELHTQFVQSQYDMVSHLHEIGGNTDEDLNRAALNLEIARRELKQLAEQIDNQQASLRTDLKAVDLQISIRQSELRELQRQAELADACARSDGVVTWINDHIGTHVAPGEAIAKIADLGSFRIIAAISDIHADKLHNGGRINVRLGEHTLIGHITAVEPSVENGAMTFIVELDNKADPLLRPNLRADVYVVTASKESVIRVKNGAFYTASVDQKVFIVEGDRAVARNITTGLANFDWVELTGDISPGDEVIISNMRDYRNMDEITIED